MKIGDKLYQWVFLHARNGEQFAGLVEVPKDLKNDDEFYKRCLAADLLQPKIMVEDAAPRALASGHDLLDEVFGPVGKVRREVDRIIELRNPHQVIVQAGHGKQVVACLPLSLGDRMIFLRSGEMMFAQFLDDKSPIVIDIRQATSGIVDPTAAKPGEERTEGGIIIPGAGTVNP